MPAIKYDVIIVGGGPAGLTAGLYSTRAGLNTLLLEKSTIGGQVSKTSLIENYPGFPEGIDGVTLIERMVEQAKKFGVEMAIEGAESLQIKDKEKIIKTKKQEYQTKAVIIATGSKFKELGVPGEIELLGKGVSYCAVCDGPLYRNRVVGVVGGGDSALSEAIYLSKLAQKVYLIHRRDQFRAARSIQDKVLATKNIEVMLNTIIKEIKGQQKIESITISDRNTNKDNELKLDGLFIYVGAIPNTDFLKGMVNLDEEGYITTNENLETNIPGIFAAGDVRKKTLRQISTSVGDGALAAIMAKRYLINQ
jgi:thioredoxin reductase (NADPH)